MPYHKQYRPVLKGKRGDLWALANLKPASRGLITPVIELVPPSAAKTEEQKMTESVTGIETCWGKDAFFGELIWRQLLPELPSGRHIVTTFFDKCRQRGMSAVPVTSALRNESFQQAIRQVIQTDRRGLMLRFSPDSLEGDVPARRVIDAFLRFFDISPNEVDLMFDFGSVIGVGSGLLVSSARSAIGALPYLAEWRTFTLTAGSFPSTLANLPQYTWTRLPRKEWMAWRALGRGANVERLPFYGDYAIGDPELPSGRAANSANMRYSVDEDFFIWRGAVTTSHPRGSAQIHDICADLIARPEYAGAEFSRGDREIRRKATTTNSTGSPEHWRQWATNHYLELVASQVASLPEL